MLRAIEEEPSNMTSIADFLMTAVAILESDDHETTLKVNLQQYFITTDT